MIPLAEQDAIRVKLAQEMLQPVKIDYFTQRELDIVVPGRRPCAFCKPTGNMLRELAALNDLISLRVHMFEDDREAVRELGVERIPGIVLRGRSEASLKFYGMPGGTEFPAFLDSIVDVSRNEVLFSTESVESLQKIEEDLRIRVFVTPTCPYCPTMTRAVFQMAMITPRIKAEVIEANEFPELSQRYNVQAVPLTVIEDRVAIPGAVPEKALVEQVLKAAHSPAARPSEISGPATPATVAQEPPREGEPLGGSGLVLP